MRKLVLVGALASASCGCIAAGSMVLTPRGKRRIESLSPGDEVIAIDPSTGAQVTTTVEATRTVTRETSVLVGDGWALRCTTDHPLYDPVARDWAPAGDWMLGKRQTLLFVDEEEATPREVQVRARTLDGTVVDVVDISVAHELHNFVTEGILVHNKSPVRPLCEEPNGSTSTPTREGDLCTCPDGAVGRVECNFGVGPKTCAGCSGGSVTDAGTECSEAPAVVGPLSVWSLEPAAIDAGTPCSEEVVMGNRGVWCAGEGLPQLDGGVSVVLSDGTVLRWTGAPGWEPPALTPGEALRVSAGRRFSFNFDGLSSNVWVVLRTSASGEWRWVSGSDPFSPSPGPREVLGVGFRAGEPACFLEYALQGEPWLRVRPTGHVLETSPEQEIPPGAHVSATTPTGRWQLFWWSSRVETLRTVYDVRSPPTGSFAASRTGP